jgi:hypothetical protein
VGSCDHGDELQSSIKDGEFLGYLRVLLASEGGLCSVQSVSQSVSQLQRAAQRSHKTFPLRLMSVEHNMVGVPT